MLRAPAGLAAHQQRGGARDEPLDRGDELRVRPRRPPGGVEEDDRDVARPGRVPGPLAPTGHANTLVQGRQSPCYTDTYGMFHTGTGATSDPAGNPGASCDSATSSTVADREVFTLNTSIMAVAEAALGRMGADQLRHYTTGNAAVQLDIPAVLGTALVSAALFVVANMMTDILYAFVDPRIRVQ